MFAKLAVFSGGFTLAAAEAICDADLDTLHALADRSLIKVQDGRYRMLETVRAYALDKLHESGQAEELRRRHADWFVELLAPKSGWYGPRPQGLAVQAVQELDNLRRALEWAAASREYETTAALAHAAAYWVWFSQGLLDEAERWIVRVRAHELELSSLHHAKVLDAAGELALLRGEVQAGVALCEQGLAIYREFGNPHDVCFALNGRQQLAAAQGDLPAARAALEEAIFIARANTVPGFIPIALNNLADISIEEGDLSPARALCEEALALNDSLGITDESAFPLINLAHIASLQGRDADAARLARESARVALSRDDKRTVAAAAMEIAWPLATQGEFERAARLLGAGLGFLETAGITLQRTDAVCEERTRQGLLDEYDAPTLQTLLDEGRGTPLEDAVRDALTETPARDDPPTRITRLRRELPTSP